MDSCIAFVAEKVLQSYQRNHLSSQLGQTLSYEHLYAINGGNVDYLSLTSLAAISRRKKTQLKS